MRPRLFVLVALLAGVVASTLLFHRLSGDEPSRLSLAEMERVGVPHIRSSFSPKNQEDAIGRGDFEVLRLRDPRTGQIPPNMRAREMAFAQRLPRIEELGAGKAWAETWTRRGPMNVGGRTRALAIDLGYNGTSNRRILAGGISGGVYLSEDSGASWQLTTSLNDVASVTCIAQDPRNPQVWYHGTGERLGNSASGGLANFLGQGIFKSQDGGRTWQQLAGTVGQSRPHVFDNFFDIIWNVVVHPQTSAVFAATYGTIQRSTDGGNTWQVLLGGNENNYNDMTDVAIGADGAVYATLSRNGANLQQYGVFRSQDGGDNWTDITPPALAQDPYRMVLAPAPSDPGTLYLIVQGNQEGGTAPDHQLFRFNAAAGAWTDLSAALPNEQGVDGNASFSSQGGYDLLAKVKPDDPETVWIGGTNLYRSRDGGQTFTRVGGYAGPANYAGYENHHSDQHSMAFFPNDSNAAISGHDGGLSYSPNILETPQKWTNINNGYVTTQFYALALDPQPGSETIFGGLQDNGTWATEVADGATAWTDIMGGDGGFASIAPGGYPFYVSSQLGNIIRASVEGNQLAYSIVAPAGGQQYQFIAPFELDPNDARVMYLAAGHTIWRNSNLDDIPAGNSDPTSINWTQLTGSAVGTLNSHSVTTLSVSKSPANRLFFGTTNYQDDTKLIRVDNPAGNGPGTDITPPGLTGGSFPSSIALNPDDANEIVATFSNYNVPSVWYSSNGGTSWTNVDGNLGGEDGPSIRWAEIVPTAGGKRYFLATSTGVYSANSLNGTNTTWALEGGDTIGNVVVNMIRARAADGLVVVGTHGRGVYSARLGGGGNPGGTAVAEVNVQQVDLQARPGERSTATFELRNTGTAPLTYDVTPRYTGTPAPRIGGLSNFLAGAARSRSLRLGGPEAPGKAVQAAPNPRPASVTARSSAGNDVLLVDDGNASPDDFLGFQDGSDFYWSNQFDAPAGGFTLERLQFYMRSGTAIFNSVWVAVYDADLNTLASGTVAPGTSVSGKWFEVPLTEPITFAAGASFYLEVGTTNGNATPAGVDLAASVPGRSFYCDADGNCANLNSVQGYANGAFLIRAAGTAGGGGQNQPPTAVARVSTDQAQVNQAVRFDASQSTDADGQIVSYLWNFGDGTTSNQAVVDHAYAAAGTYAVTVTVTDNLGATGQASGQITVSQAGGNQAPRAVAQVSKTQARVGEAVTFDATQSTDADGQVTAFQWTFGDGTTSTRSTDTHAYAQPGTYTYVLRVTDDDGAASEASGSISVTEAGARLTAEPASGTVAPGTSRQITVTFDATGLAAGTYAGELALNTNGGQLALPVRIQVSGTVDREPDAVLPARVHLQQNYPNPFNPLTTIRYELDAPAQVRLHVFDVSGRRVQTLDAGTRPAGAFAVRWDGTDFEGRAVPSGVYLYRLELALGDGRTVSESKKMILLK